MSELTRSSEDLLKMLAQASGTADSGNSSGSTMPFLAELRNAPDPDEPTRTVMRLTDYGAGKDADGNYPTYYSPQREVILLAKQTVRGIEEYEQREGDEGKRFYTDCFSAGQREKTSWQGGQKEVIGSALGFGKYATEASGGKSFHFCGSCDGAPKGNGDGKRCKSTVLLFLYDVETGLLCTMRISNTVAYGPMGSEADKRATVKHTLLGWMRNAGLRDDEQGVASVIGKKQGVNSRKINWYMHALTVRPFKFPGIQVTLNAFAVTRDLVPTPDKDMDLLYAVLEKAKVVGTEDKPGEVQLRELQRRLKKAVGSLQDDGLEDVYKFFDGTQEELPMFDSNKLALTTGGTSQRVSAREPNPSNPPAHTEAPKPTPVAAPAPIDLDELLPDEDDTVDADFTPLPADGPAAELAEFAKMWEEAKDWVADGSESPEVLAARLKLVTLAYSVKDKVSGLLTKGVGMKSDVKQINGLVERLEARFGNAA